MLNEIIDEIIIASLLYLSTLNVPAMKRIYQIAYLLVLVTMVSISCKK